MPQRVKKRKDPIGTSIASEEPRAVEPAVVEAADEAPAPLQTAADVSAPAAGPSPDADPADAGSIAAAIAEPDPAAAITGLQGAAEPTGTPRRRAALRFALAFAFGLLAVLALAAGALAAYESSNDGHITPGVHVGSVDVSGLAPAAAAARLRDAYGGLAVGQITLVAGGNERTLSYADLGRRVDVDSIVARAMAIGRDGPVMERIASNVRTLFRGIDVAPEVTLERAALRFEIAALAKAVGTAPVDATVTTGATGFLVAPGVDGKAADIDGALSDAEAALLDPAAPASIRLEIAIRNVPPVVSTDEATAARAAAERIAVDLELVSGGESWTIPGSSLQGWVTFTTTPDGGFAPVVAQQGLEGGLAVIAGEVKVDPVSATFLLSDNKQIVGVTDAKAGRALDVSNTMLTLEKVIDQRVDGLSVSRAPISVTAVEPDLTTAEATKTAPLMKPISEWTTYFPVYVNNGFGANIWIPARDIDGTVVMPGQWFDFWKAIGPVTSAHGYKQGGAIINGHTEPQGALAGGICSTSTTLFNAALRAGLEMGARKNHYYYINRYPLGLDATVFESSSGSVQSMTFRNDTAAPILIRGTGWSVGSKGYVKFTLWSVPTGRTLELTAPIVKNVRPAVDTTVYTTDLAPGVKKRTETPTAGKDVWVTRIVRDKDGVVIHKETYYSHYSRVDGIVQIGISAPAPTPAPTPAPLPDPTPTPTP